MRAYPNVVRLIRRVLQRGAQRGACARARVSDAGGGSISPSWWRVRGVGWKAGRGGSSSPEARKAANAARRRGARSPAPLLGCTAWDTFGKSDRTNRHNRPYIPDLSESQPRSALAPEAAIQRSAIQRSTRSDRTVPFVSFPSAAGRSRSRSRSRLTADVATESHGDFHENRSQVPPPLHPHPTPHLRPLPDIAAVRHCPAAWIATEGSVGDADASAAATTAAYDLKVQGQSCILVNRHATIRRPATSS